MKLKTKIAKIEDRIVHERSKGERIGAAILAAATIFGVSHLSRQTIERSAIVMPQRVLSPVFEPISQSSSQSEIEESEVTRLPVKFDDAVLRTASIAGK